MPVIMGILFGIFFTHNVEQTAYFKCKYDKEPAACEKIAELEAKK